MRVSYEIAPDGPTYASRLTKASQHYKVPGARHGRTRRHAGFASRLW